MLGDLECIFEKANQSFLHHESSLILSGVSGRTLEHVCGYILVIYYEIDTRQRGWI